RGRRDGGVRRPRFRGDPARRHRQTRGRRQGDDLPALQGQGIDVRGTDPHGDRAAGRHADRTAAGGRLDPRRAGRLCARLHRGDRDHAARRHRAADHCRGPALSRNRRLLLPRGDLAWARRHARADRACGGARRNPLEGAGALSADHGRAGDRRGGLENAVRKTRTIGRTRNVSRPSRSDFWRTEGAMNFICSKLLAALAMTTLLAGCNEHRDPGFQGWVEADMIFVSPDESGRVTGLKVREGDEVKKGEQLYTVDDDLQQADLNQNKATLANAQQSYDRAASLSKTGSGTQANLDAAVSTLRVAEARVATSETRLARRQGFAPVNGTIQQIYFREGEMVQAQRPVLSIMPPGNMKIRFYVPESELPKLAFGDEVKVTCDNCAADLTAKIYFIATTAEYTPPVIYSLDERNKLVYLIQARPSHPDALRVGQPITIYLNARIPVADKR